MVQEEVRGRQGENFSSSCKKVQLETGLKFRAMLPLSKPDFLASLSVCRIIISLLFSSFPVALCNHSEEYLAILRTLCFITVDFGGGRGFVCTDKQHSTAGADLRSGSVLRTCLTQ